MHIWMVTCRRSMTDLLVSIVLVTATSFAWDAAAVAGRKATTKRPVYLPCYAVLSVMRMAWYPATSATPTFGQVRVRCLWNLQLHPLRQPSEASHKLCFVIVNFTYITKGAKLTRIAIKRCVPLNICHMVLFIPITIENICVL